MERQHFVKELERGCDPPGFEGVWKRPEVKALVDGAEAEMKARPYQWETINRQLAESVADLVLGSAKRGEASPPVADADGDDDDLSGTLNEQMRRKRARMLERMIAGGASHVSR